MIELVFAISMFYDQQIVDLAPAEERRAFVQWLLYRYPDPINELLHILSNDVNHECVRLCPVDENHGESDEQ